jgi:ribulose-5-phosphate 4-epimerase/fuculose-1-phosphate aldolase
LGCKTRCYLLDLGDGILQPPYAGGEEIFSALGGDKITQSERIQRIQGIKSNHGPISLANNWIETVKVVIVMDETNDGEQNLSHTLEAMSTH